MQTAVVWSCFPFIRSGQNHLARHSERGKKTRRTKEEMGRQHQGMDRPGVRQVPEGSGEQGKMEKTVCKLICGALTTLAVKGLMMMLMMCVMVSYESSKIYYCSISNVCEQDQKLFHFAYDFNIIILATVFIIIMYTVFIIIILI